MADITISDGVSASIQAACKTIETCVSARMEYLRMLSPEQRATVLDMEVKGQKLAFDVFVQPLADLVGAIKGAFNK